MLNRPLLLLVALLVAAAPRFQAAEPVRYHFTFPEPEHHWVQVEATFTDLGDAPVELRMSRSSPGRYSLHEFAKNVYDVQAFSRRGQALTTTRPDPYGWSVAGHDGSLTIKYKVFGDQVDGTYLAIDTTHAHINMPAVVMWARGLDDRPATVTFAPPDLKAGSTTTDRAAGQLPARWQVATQLHAGSTLLEFTAPNLQYLMDSPAEFGPVSIRQFLVGGRTFRFALHHTGTDAELDAFVVDVQKIVKEAGAVYGEYPDYEPGSYTFLADYLPYAGGDGMEHRNSTVITSPSSLRDNRAGLLDTVSHEFFHGWNMERIRPRSLEPFDFERANMSGELWLGEGFTQYFGPLILSRAGLADLHETVGTMSGLISRAALNPARLVRSAEEASRMAVFTDGGHAADRTNWSNTVISYYPFGGAIALALDLTLRERSDSRLTLDDYMRAMWRIHGKPGGRREGYVDRPYTMADAEARLAEVSGDRAFALDFFTRYVRGHDVADYTRLLAHAGLVLRKANPGAASWGDVRFEPRTLRLAMPPAMGTPAYLAGLDRGDELKELDGSPVTFAEDVAAVVRRHRPGDAVAVVFADRGGAVRRSTVRLVEDVKLVLSPVESNGGTLSVAQKTFRDHWLGPR
jgi:predicted metalloprotease with PDZ domain